jgi:hypothetical protein
MNLNRNWMKIRIVAFVLFICLISCKKSEIPVNKFIGTWYDTEYVIPNLSIFKINPDSTFLYTSGACTWQGFSKGKWKMIGDSIELNSVNSDTCYEMVPFMDCIRFENPGDETARKITNCKVRGKADFLIFSHEKFYIKNDSLVYKLKPSSKCPDTLKIVFARTEKIRK